MSESQRPFLTISQAAERLGIHVNTLRAWSDKGLVQHVKLPSGYRRFPTSEIDRLRREMGFEGLEGKAAA